MFALSHVIGAAVVVPALLGPAAGTDCQLDRLQYVSSDERALDRFAAAVHDVAAFGKQGAVFTPQVVPILRFRLRLDAWQNRLHATDTIDDVGVAARQRHAKTHVADGVLPHLPYEFEYRLDGNHLLLIERRTHTVIDLLPDAFGR